MWRVIVSEPARKAVRRFPVADQVRIAAALESLVADPFAGDIRSLGNDEYRRRVGSYRVRFTVYANLSFVEVTAIARRSSTTYRKRR